MPAVSFPRTQRHTVDGPAKSESPVDRWFIHVYPIIYRVSTCFNHPFGDAGFRRPIHSIVIVYCHLLYPTGVFLMVITIVGGINHPQMVGLLIMKFTTLV